MSEYGKQNSHILNFLLTFFSRPQIRLFSYSDRENKGIPKSWSDGRAGCPKSRNFGQCCTTNPEAYKDTYYAEGIHQLTKSLSSISEVLERYYFFTTLSTLCPQCQLSAKLALPETDIQFNQNPAARLAKKLFEHMRRDAASIRIQKHMRTHSARKAYLEVYESAIVIQTGLRAMAARNEHRFRRETKASIIIQVCTIMPIMICKYFL